jgi:serine/threonine protein kinase
MTYNGWEPIGEKLGSGGQGTVYRARSPKRSSEVEHGLKAVQQSLTSLQRRTQNISMGPQPTLVEVKELVARIAAAIGADETEDLGALKVFHMPDDRTEADKAIGRLQMEISTLKQLDHPAILKFLDGSRDDMNNPFIVTEYHPNGTLHERVGRGRGKALDVLMEFRSLVDAAVLIHSKGAIHRDIKPKNIFVSMARRLVLGDFGIVIFKDAGERLTETYERVGSRDWMAPWANAEHRQSIEDVDATLDIFPLGKVLWCMVAGRPQLPFWYFNKPAYNLEILFPDDPAMRVINALLGDCVVEEKDKCLKTAAELLIRVDQTIALIRGLGLKPEDRSSWLCMACKKGYYRGDQFLMWRPQGIYTPTTGMPLSPVAEVYACDHCGHMAVFRKQ